MASPTETFIATLSQTPPLSAELQKSLQRLNDDLDEIIKVLGYTKTVADDLDKLDDMLKTVSELLTVVSVIPEVGEAAAALKDSIAVLSEEVAPARKAADELEAEVKPFRDALGELSSALDEAIKVTAEINSTSQAFLDDFTAVVNCVNSLPAGEYKQQAQQYLDDFSSALQPTVSELNTALSTVNGVINDFYSELKALEEALDPLAAIASATEEVLAVLEPLLAPLQELENALNSIQITIPVPYPVTVSLYDVFTEFSEFIDLAMEPIQGLVDDLLKALDITLPSIPGLSDLINLEIDIPEIPDLEALMLTITNPFDALKLAIPTFTLKCPPEPGDTVPTFTSVK